MKKFLLVAACFALTLSSCIKDETSASVDRIYDAYAQKLSAEAALTQAEAEAKIEEFIQYYVQNNITTAEKFENLFDDVPHEDDDIAEFSLNYHLAYINCNDLFEGDSKFYKDSQTFLKRAKETQGSGVPYSIFDITAPMFGEIHKEV